MLNFNFLFLVASALLSVSALTNSASPIVVFSIAGYIELTCVYTLDIGWKGLYSSGPVETDLTLYSHSIGINLYSLILVDWKLTLLNDLSYFQISNKLVPFSITPYNRIVTYVRPLSFLQGASLFDI